MTLVILGYSWKQLISMKTRVMVKHLPRKVVNALMSYFPNTKRRICHAKSFSKCNIQ